MALGGLWFAREQLQHLYKAKLGNEGTTIEQSQGFLSRPADPITYGHPSNPTYEMVPTNKISRPGPAELC